MIYVYYMILYVQSWTFSTYHIYTYIYTYFLLCTLDTLYLFGTFYRSKNELIIYKTQMRFKPRVMIGGTRHRKVYAPWFHCVKFKSIPRRSLLIQSPYPHKIGHDGFSVLPASYQITTQRLIIIYKFLANSLGLLLN